MQKIQFVIAPLLFICLSCGGQQIEEEQAEKTSRADSASVENDIIQTSVITCPHCDFSKEEELPTESCLIKYECTNCGEVLYPKQGDCCVFCTWGDHKCPSMQE